MVKAGFLTGSAQLSLSVIVQFTCRYREKIWGRSRGQERDQELTDGRQLLEVKILFTHVGYNTANIPPRAVTFTPQTGESHLSACPSVPQKSPHLEIQPSWRVLSTCMYFQCIENGAKNVLLMVLLVNLQKICFSLFFADTLLHFIVDRTN